VCLSHLIYTVQPCLIHTYHAVPLPCHDHAVLKATSYVHGTARHGRGMASPWHVRLSIGRPDRMLITCLRSASSVYHAEFHEDCYKKHTNPLNQRFPNFFQVGTTFISQNVLRTALLLSPLKENYLRFSTTVCDTQFTLI
jgi:hypothetical protein